MNAENGTTILHLIHLNAMISDVIDSLAHKIEDTKHNLKEEQDNSAADLNSHEERDKKKREGDNGRSGRIPQKSLERLEYDLSLASFQQPTDYQQ